VQTHKFPKPGGEGAAKATTQTRRYETGYAGIHACCRDVKTPSRLLNDGQRVDERCDEGDKGKEREWKRE